MRFTLSGSVTEASLPHSQKALSPIAVTPSGTVYAARLLPQG